jgi:ectoine hydroxylase-related dioxygenase (phytanoyl-CoA dioxygenase family)
LRPVRARPPQPTSGETGATHADDESAPLEDVTIENGCLWFVPGSHRNPVLAHHHQDGDPSIHVLVAEGPDVSNAVPVPMKRGAMSFHHPRMLHYSRPNTTDRPRRAYANEFQSAPIVREVPADRPWIIEGREAMAKVAAARNA